MNVVVGVAGLVGMLFIGASAANAAIDDAKALELMKKGGCNVCHSVDKKILGPAYKDVAAKRKGEADAVRMLEKAVRNGSKDAYGSIPMPPNPESKINDGEVHELVEWVLTK